MDSLEQRLPGASGGGGAAVATLERRHARGGQPSRAAGAGGGGGGGDRRQIAPAPDHQADAQTLWQQQPQPRALQPNQQQQVDPQLVQQRQHARRGWGQGERMRRLELATCLFSLCIQTVLWARTASSLDGRGHAHQAAQVALQAASLALSLCLPSVAYRQYRVWLISGLRIANACVPSHRSTTEGTAVLLQNAATPHLRGTLQDYFRVAIGTRVLLVAVIACILHQPPLAVLLQQSALMLLVAKNADYCATPLLSDPLSRRRLQGFLACLDLPLSAVIPLSTSTLIGSMGAGSHATICRAALNMHQLVIGILFPTLMAALWSPHAGDMQQQQQQQQQHNGRWGRLWRRAAALKRAWWAANSVVQELFAGGDLHIVQRFLSMWMLLAQGWLAAKAMAADPAAAR